MSFRNKVTDHQDQPAGTEMQEYEKRKDCDSPETESLAQPKGRWLRYKDKIMIVVKILLVLLMYAWAIAGYIVNRDHSRTYIGIVIFITICLVLYGMHFFLGQYIGRLFQCTQNIKYFNIIVAVIVGLALIGVLIYFIVESNPLRKLQALFGLLVYIALCIGFSKDRGKIKVRSILWGLGLQYVFALFILKTKPGEDLFDFIGDQTARFLDYSKNGSSFVFGQVAINGATEEIGEANQWKYGNWAFQILPTVVFFSSFVSIMFHLGILQQLIMGISKLMFYTMQTSTVESLNAAGNIFVGMTEAPLMIRPFLPYMTKSEIHAVMTGGFATIAGGVLAAYIQMGAPAKHLIAASVMSCPAALAISKLVYPEREKSLYESGDDFEIPPLESAKNFIEAAKNGASVSIGLVANIAVMLITFLAFYACFENWFFYLMQCVNINLTFSELIGYIFVPFAWMLGIEEKECQQAGVLLAKKILINEYIAYQGLGETFKDGLISERTNTIMTYALCGFGNISSMGIQVGALSVMAPDRKSDLSKLVFSAMMAGTVACQMTACIAGILLD